MVAAVAALAWSNSPGFARYSHRMDLPIGIGLDRRMLILPPDQWVNDGLMTLFFLTFGLEIRREMTEGQLSFSAAHCCAASASP
jgi:NhaA family Na+:H+ antiporter